MSDLIERLRYPLEAEVWFRESTDEWVLEINGTINNCCLSSRHTSPKETAPEDVPDQSHLYDQLEAQQAEIAKLLGDVEALKRTKKLIYRRSVSFAERLWRAENLLKRFNREASAILERKP